MDGKIPKPEGPPATITEWIKNDGKALPEIILIIDPKELKSEKDCKTTSKLWEKLQEIHQSKGPARKAYLLKLLILNEMRSGSRACDIVDKLNNLYIIVNWELLTIIAFRKNLKILGALLKVETICPS